MKIHSAPVPRHRNETPGTPLERVPSLSKIRAAGGTVHLRLTAPIITASSPPPPAPTPMITAAGTLTYVSRLVQVRTGTRVTTTLIIIVTSHLQVRNARSQNLTTSGNGNGNGEWNGFIHWNRNRNGNWNGNGNGNGDRLIDALLFLAGRVGVWTFSFIRLVLRNNHRVRVVQCCCDGHVHVCVLVNARVRNEGDRYGNVVVVRVLATGRIFTWRCRCWRYRCSSSSGLRCSSRTGRWMRTTTVTTVLLLTTTT